MKCRNVLSSFVSELFVFQSLERLRIVSILTCKCVKAHSNVIALLTLVFLCVHVHRVHACVCKHVRVCMHMHVCACTCMSVHTYLCGVCLCVLVHKRI